MLKTKLTIETVGKPEISALSESEKKTFFETLLSDITALYEKSLKQ